VHKAQGIISMRVFHRKPTITWVRHWWIRWVMPAYPITDFGRGQSKRRFPAYANAEESKSLVFI